MVVPTRARDDPAIGRPDCTIWTVSALEWGLIDEQTARYERQNNAA